MTCTGTHTVTQAEMTAGGNLVNTVTADSDQTLPTTGYEHDPDYAESGDDG